jgi:hypothetical protein
MIDSALEWKKTTTEVFRNIPSSPRLPSGVPGGDYETEEGVQAAAANPVDSLRYE